MNRWYKSFLHGLFPLTMEEKYWGLISSSLAICRNDRSRISDLKLNFFYYSFFKPLTYWPAIGFRLL